MAADYFTSKRSRVWLWLAMILAVAVFELRRQGRLWWCACGQLFLWAGDVQSSHNSQHLFDQYSFTHVLHGVVLCGLLAWGIARLSFIRRFLFAISIEALWEVIENSEFIIRRYREATAALGYQGDTIINSLGDILSCGIGFVIARRLGLRRSLLLFGLTEAVLLVWIRDSLLLDIFMLIHPVDAIKAWQIGH
ncbi:MAG: DUF2585 family protein [Pyrinomonadaceae bacterium]